MCKFTQNVQMSLGLSFIKGGLDLMRVWPCIVDDM